MCKRGGVGKGGMGEEGGRGALLVIGHTITTYVTLRHEVIRQEPEVGGGEVGRGGGV